MQLLKHWTMMYGQNAIGHAEQRFAQPRGDACCSTVSSFRYHSTNSRQASWEGVKGEVQKRLEPKAMDSEGELKESELEKELEKLLKWDTIIFKYVKQNCTEGSQMFPYPLQRWNNWIKLQQGRFNFSIRLHSPPVRPAELGVGCWEPGVSSALETFKNRQAYARLAQTETTLPRAFWWARWPLNLFQPGFLRSLGKFWKCLLLSNEDSRENPLLGSYLSGMLLLQKRAFTSDVRFVLLYIYGWGRKGAKVEGWDAGYLVV